MNCPFTSKSLISGLKLKKKVLIQHIMQIFFSKFGKKNNNPLFIPMHLIFVLN